jgi:hypothetical protein
LALELSDDLGLSGWQHLGVNLSDAELGGDPLRGPLVIARDEHRARLELVQARDHSFGVWPQRVAQHEQAGWVIAERDRDHCRPESGELLGLGAQSIRHQYSLLDKELRAAEENAAPGSLGADAETG